MEKEIDIHDYDRRIEWMTGRLERLKDVTPRNKRLILDFKRESITQGFSKARVSKHLEILTLVSRLLKKDFDKATKEDIMNLINGIETREFTDWTKYTYKVIIKVFYKWLNGGEDYPEEVRWIKTWTKNMRTKLPEELLTEKEITAMIEHARNPRDKALIALLSDGGWRIGEILSRKTKHIQFDDYGAVVITKGKTGMRRVRIISSVPYLVSWLNIHPLRDNPEAPLWINIKRNGREPGGMKYRYARQLLKKIANEAGIRKRIHPHLFRHSRATDLASHLTDAQMNQHFGWVQGSRMTAVYVHMSGRELDSTLLGLTGVKVEEEKMKSSIISPKKCPRCSKINAETAKFCMGCWLPLETEAAMEFDKELKSRGELVKRFLEDPEVQALFKRKMGDMFATNSGQI